MYRNISVKNSIYKSPFTGRRFENHIILLNFQPGSHVGGNRNRICIIGTEFIFHWMVSPNHLSLFLSNYMVMSLPRQVFQQAVVCKVLSQSRPNIIRPVRMVVQPLPHIKSGKLFHNRITFFSTINLPVNGLIGYSNGSLQKGSHSSPILRENAMYSYFQTLFRYVSIII